MNLLDDKSDYAKILRYAEYLKKVNKVDDGQMVFASLYGYEEDEIEQREKNPVVEPPRPHRSRGVIQHIKQRHSLGR